MGKSNRREVAKRLAQEIAVTKDPETLIRLASQLAKVMPKRRRSRKPVTEVPPIKQVKQDGRLSKRRETGSMVDQLSDAEWLVHDMVCEIEKRTREQKIKLGRELTQTEKDALLAEVTKSLSAEERAALDVLETGDGIV